MASGLDRVNENEVSPKIYPSSGMVYPYSEHTQTDLDLNRISLFMNYLFIRANEAHLLGTHIPISIPSVIASPCNCRCCCLCSDCSCNLKMICARLACLMHLKTPMSCAKKHFNSHRLFVPILIF